MSAKSLTLALASVAALFPFDGAARAQTPDGGSWHAMAATSSSTR